MTTPVRVLLVDDHALFRSGVKALLSRHTAVTIIGEAGDGAAGLAAAAREQPDVVLLDLHMPGMTGVETLTAMRVASPNSAILMLTLSEEASDLSLALRAGACGYLIKSIDADYLLQAILRAADGQVVVAEAMTDKLLAQLQAGTPLPPTHADLDKLTPREREILGLLAGGASNKLIARTLVLSESTVKIHVQNVLKKLQLNSRIQAALFAVAQGVQAPAPVKP